MKPEYAVWASMIARCNTPTHKAFPRYGGRGITVCERWRRYEHFIADMGPCPRGLTLERIDNDKGYEPSNCKWATRAAQNRNTSQTRWLTLNGVTLCQQDWCHRTGLSWGTLNGRLRRKWSVERALTTPPIATIAQSAAARENGRKFGGRPSKH
jgi:hypothetical protein